MKTQHVFSASAAAVLAMAMAAFAQAPQPSPSTAQPTRSTSPATTVTLVGCLMSENDYRRAKDTGRGGPLGTGLGSGDEFVLVNATKVASGATPSASIPECGTGATGEAYELSGNREKELAKHVGRYVEITGLLKEAKTTTGPGEEAKPTGGFDPLKRDLKLFEVDVASFREVPAGQSAAVTPPAAQVPRAPQAAAAEPARPAQPEPQAPASTTATRDNLPRTASPLPLTGLIGVLALAAGLALTRRG